MALIASIQPIEARQAVVLGQAIGAAPTELMPVLEGDEAGATVFTPSQYRGGLRPWRPRPVPNRSTGGASSWPAA